MRGPGYRGCRYHDARPRGLPWLVAAAHVVRSDLVRSEAGFSLEDFRHGSSAPPQGVLELALIDFLGAARTGFQRPYSLDCRSSLLGQLHLAQPLGQPFFFDQPADSLECFKFIHTSHCCIGNTGQPNLMTRLQGQWLWVVPDSAQPTQCDAKVTLYRCGYVRCKRLHSDPDHD